MPRIAAVPLTKAIGGGQVSGAVIVSGAVSIESGLIAVLSGEVVVSGYVAVESGAHVITQPGIQVSGAVQVSGEVIAKVSGEVVDIATPTTIPTAGIFVVTAASGGATLPPQAVISVTIKAMSENSGNIHIAGTALQSGEGFVLEPGEAVNIDIDNLNKIYVLAEVSGDRVTYLAVA